MPLVTLRKLTAYLSALWRLPRTFRALQQELPVLRSRIDTVERETSGLRILHEVSAMQLLAADRSAPRQEPSDAPLLQSAICKAADFDLELYRYWCAQFGENPLYHRKQWEWVFISQALLERGALKPGKRGLGFGVGREPLTSLFAKMGCSIVATDGDAEDARRQGWEATEQYASNLASLNERGICPSKLFSANVCYRTVDMRRVPSELQAFDFCWSACALEHLGSIEAGCDFIRRSLATLVPLGIAVHTTEFNVFSDDATYDNDASTVLFRKRDLERLVQDLQLQGHYVEPLDLQIGTRPIDNYIDPGPFYSEKSYGKGLPHLKLLLGGFVTTSVGLIVRKRAES